MVLNACSAPMLYVAPVCQGKSLYVRPGAMLAAKNMTMETQTAYPGITGCITRLFSDRESFLVNLFTAGKGGGWIAFEEDIPGQICEYSLARGSRAWFSYGALIASDAAIKTQDVYTGIFGNLRGTSNAMVEVSLPIDASQESARVWIRSEAGVVKHLSIRPEDGPIAVDNNNIIGYTEGLNISPQPLGSGIFSWLFSQEGFVNQCTGSGEIFFGSGSPKEKSRSPAGDNLPCTSATIFRAPCSSHPTAEIIRNQTAPDTCKTGFGRTTRR